MSKLLRLKDWLTLEDAAKHLSIMFGEDVAKADILRLALDGRLTLSTNLLNGAKARCGPIVAREKAKYFEVPSDLRAAALAKSPEEYQGSYVKLPHGVPLITGDVIELADDIVYLQGVYDLPMIGNERLDVEHEYQFLTDGPPVTLHGFDGAFVSGGDGTYCQLQESYDENEFRPGSLAQGRKLEGHIERDGLDADAADELRAKHKADRELFKKRRAENPPRENYFPAGGLPSDSVLVVRSAALIGLHNASSAPEISERKTHELGTRERETLLKLVIGMAIEGYRHSPEAARSDAPAEIASDLAKHGISVTDDTVRKWLKEAAHTVLPKKPGTP